MYVNLRCGMTGRMSKVAPKKGQRTEDRRGLVSHGYQPSADGPSVAATGFWGEATFAIPPPWPRVLAFGSLPSRHDGP